jgi:hypothetical protein
MKHQLAWQRRFAHKLLRHGVALLPPERSSWAGAMRIEIQHIEDDREALDWALGSLRACLSERLRVLRPGRLFSAHSLGILWIVVFIVSSAYNVSIALAARLGYQRTASALGWWMKDFQYERFSQFADSIPIGLFALMGLIVLLFTASLNLKLRNRPTGFATFCCAMTLSLAAWLYQLGIPAYLQAMSAPHRWRIGICFVLTASVLTALRLFGSTPNTSTHA